MVRLQSMIGAVLMAASASAEFAQIYEWDTNNLGGFSVADDFPTEGERSLLLTSYSFGDFQIDNVQGT